MNTKYEVNYLRIPVSILPIVLQASVKVVMRCCISVHM